MSSCRLHKFVADVAVLAEEHVLLVKYKDTSKYDRQSGWFLPDDLLNHLEHPADGAKRLLKEQVGLSLSSVVLSHIESFEGGDGSWHMIFHYKAGLDKRAQITPTGNVGAVEWFALGQLPERSQVAHNGWAIDVLNDINKRA